MNIMSSLPTVLHVFFTSMLEISFYSIRKGRHSFPFFKQKALENDNHDDMQSSPILTLNVRLNSAMHSSLLKIKLSMNSVIQSTCYHLHDSLLIVQTLVKDKREIQNWTHRSIDTLWINRLCVSPSILVLCWFFCLCFSLPMPLIERMYFYVSQIKYLWLVFFFQDRKHKRWSSEINSFVYALAKLLTSIYAMNHK